MPESRHRLPTTKPTHPPLGGPTVDNDNETILAVIVIVLFVLGIFRVVGDMQELYRQTELKGQELSRWSKQ